MSVFLLFVFLLPLKYLAAGFYVVSVMCTFSKRSTAMYSQNQSQGQPTLQLSLEGRLIRLRITYIKA